MEAIIPIRIERRRIRSDLPMFIIAQVFKIVKQKLKKGARNSCRRGHF
jgi:hypothetical protein